MENPDMPPEEPEDQPGSGPKNIIDNQDPPAGPGDLGSPDGIAEVLEGQPGGMPENVNNRPEVLGESEEVENRLPASKRKPSFISEDNKQAPASLNPQTGQRTGSPPISSSQGVTKRVSAMTGHRPLHRPVHKDPGVPVSASTPGAQPGQASISMPGIKSMGLKTVTGRAGTHPAESTSKGINPGLKLRAFQAAARKSPPPRIPLKYRLRPDGTLTRRAAWDVAAISSLVVNAILVGIVVIMAFQIRNLKTAVNGVLGGLYGSLVEMDKAGIATTITVDTQIPLNFSLPIQQETDVTLSSNVAIPGAYFLLNGSSVPVNVTLPAGTTLPIVLNMTIPVQATVPVSLQVPINLPMNQTALHAPFTSLQKTILPLYCVFNQDAQYPQGFYLCGDQTARATTTP